MAGQRAETLTGPAEDAVATRNGLLLDLDSIDLSRRLVDRKGLQAWIPHRGAMQLLDSVVWVNDAMTSGVGHRTVRHDEFWVHGHFPSRAMFPGVLMVETAAQLALYLFNIRMGFPQLPAFLRIEDCSFRHHVKPGDEFFVLCREVKIGRRRFVSEVQGLVGQTITFQAQITGMSLGQLEGGFWPSPE
jgi:3-hydroxymyristoyl/3-hydroxydecanoyl-(acyl carrier protein) dehydratase